MFKAVAVPRPNKEAFESKHELFHEFVNFEFDNLDIVGLPIWFNHDATRKYKDVGLVTSQFYTPQGDLACVVHLNKSGGARALLQLLLDTDKYKEVSLQHRTRITDTKDGIIRYSKAPIEISVCKKGRRNTPILQCMTYEQLENGYDQTWEQASPSAMAHLRPTMQFNVPEILLFTQEAMAQGWDSVKGLKSAASSNHDLWTSAEQPLLKLFDFSQASPLPVNCGDNRQKKMLLMPIADARDDCLRPVLRIAREKIHATCLDSSAAIITSEGPPSSILPVGDCMDTLNNHTDRCKRSISDHSEKCIKIRFADNFIRQVSTHSHGDNAQAQIK